MSLLLNMLSRLVITFLPRSKHLLISWLQSPSAVILKSPKIKFLTASIVFPSICHEVMESTDAKAGTLNVDQASDSNNSYPKSLQMVTAAMKLKDAYSLEGKL